MANTSPVTKSREERLKELELRMAQQTTKPSSVPFITTDGKIKDGKVVMLLDVLALEDSVHPSSSGKSTGAFQSLEIPGLGRFNINNIRK